MINSSYSFFLHYVRFFYTILKMNNSMKYVYKYLSPVAVNIGFIIYILSYLFIICFIILIFSSYMKLIFPLVHTAYIKYYNLKIIISSNFRI